MYRNILKKASVVSSVIAVAGIMATSSAVAMPFGVGGNCAGSTVNALTAEHVDSDLSNSDCTGATINATTGSYYNANFSDSSFDSATLNASSASFSLADFTDSTFVGSNIVASSNGFNNTNFQNVDFTGATFSNVGVNTFSNANFDNVNFSGADLSEMLDTYWAGVVYENNNGPFYDADTIFHTSFDAAAAGWSLVQGVPTPATFGLLLLGLSGLAVARARKSV